MWNKLTNTGINANLLDLIGLFPHKKIVKAGVSQGSLLGPLFFFIYINDLLQGLISDIELFADDTSLFSIANCSKASASVRNNLLKIQNRACQWKISLNKLENEQEDYSSTCLTMQLWNSGIPKSTFAFS